MYASASYPTDPAQVEAFVAGQRHGTLVATPPGGFPSVSILPFVRRAGIIELHCVQADPTFAALRANPRVTFLVSDYLTWTPHDFVDERDAGRATLHFRAVAYECEARWSTEPADVAAALARLLAAYEPEGVYAPVRDGDLYGARLRRLAALELTVRATRAKFKVGPAVPDARKREVARRIRVRGMPGDARAADVIEASLEP
ncbi:MAG TPA: FMN-binding negative transcriptional regulator [Candidatus Eisenbacteria bacterium]|nr:FMN-binding negative transcriptional regulator [Candidatus Eisenbacteria bacterium]